MATPTDSASPPSTALRPPAPAPLPAAPGPGVCAVDIRLVKDKLSRVAGGEGDKVTVNKDYTTGFVEGASARIFIHCLSTTLELERERAVRYRYFIQSNPGYFWGKLGNVEPFYPIESWVFLGKMRECCHGSKQLTVHFTVAESKIQKTLLEKRELHMERDLLLD
ncbi:unnamed protein product [Miscanthus lutarioriparius]|uniref:Uncharacterized protein n=1 Tax=Miscanthus lutarioriparius TaxID=422564 RepID=A0A811MNW3_9POAL|nr:unnamed protein product [Miscanthus lutarioriparius]